MTQFESDDLEGMRASIEKALALQPNHTRSWVQLTIYAQSVGDTQLETHARARACELGALVLPARLTSAQRQHRADIIEHRAYGHIGPAYPQRTDAT